jgi:hypothetical protein
MAKRMREYRSQKELKRDAEDVSEKIGQVKKVFGRE